LFFLIPLGTTRPCWRVPYATYGLIVANVVVFVIEVFSPDALPEGFVPAHPSLFTWFISMFMHAGLMHLAGNMLFLWLFGTITEDVLGPKMFLLFYFGGDLGATALDAMMGSMASAHVLDVPRVGASGAIAGIMGLAAICFVRTKIRVWYVFSWWLLYWRTGVWEVGAPAGLALWVGWEFVQGTLQAALGSAGGVAHWAHVGGFVFGLVGAVALSLHKKVPRGDLVSGRRELRSAYDAYEQAGELQQIVVQDPDDGDAWAALGRSYEMSARVDKAKEAHTKALFLFLKQRRIAEAASEYAVVAEYGIPADLTASQQFGLACALEDAGKAREACRLFVQHAIEHPRQETAETALMRAAEIARTQLKDPEQAADCYRRLLGGYPYSTWRGMAQERLRELNLPEPKPLPAEATGEEPRADSGLRKL